MAFTDLEEHLAEVFGDCRSIDGFQPDLWIRQRYRRTKTPAQKARDIACWARIRSMRRAEQQSRALGAGERPWRCQRPGCCNLLPVSTHGGPPPFYCRRTCRMTKYDREARRTPEAKARKNERRRVKSRAV